MFYIISSRIPFISSDKTNRKYFKVFVIGSIFYVLLHYYLNKEVRQGMIEKVRKYIYYAMGVDLAIACVLLKYIKTSIPNDTENNDDNDSEDDNKDEKLIKELEEQRRLFLEEHQRRLLHEKMMEQKMREQKELEQKELEQKKQELKKKKKETESDKSERSEKKQKKETKKEKVIKQETEEEKTESELPIYDK